MTTQKLKGKVAVITGASRGLGRAMAVALGAEGASVALVARDRAKLEAVACEATVGGNAAHVFALDVTSEQDVNALASQVREALGPADILINNAGINIRKRLVDFSLSEWRSVVDANLTSVFLMCRAFAPQMMSRGYGRIVNLASIMSHVSMAERSAYSASKTALLGLTRALSLELAAEAITVNCISPGPFATEMNQKIINDHELNAQFISKIPVGRWGNVEEVGALAVYLCLPEAGFVTGTDVVIDGGWLAQ